MFYRLKKEEFYDRHKAQLYLERYTDKPNTLEYPYYKDADCANFISQAIAAGGMNKIYGPWDSYDSWFCAATNVKDLKNVAITWRTARYFRKHWGQERGIGLNRAKEYYEFTALEVLDNYHEIYKLLQIGDVIQHGNPKNSNLPYHTQMVYNKDFNYTIGIYDIFIAQHTRNVKGISLYKYLSMQQYRESRKVYIYIIT